jgi:predicted nucleic acid-binding protein
METLMLNTNVFGRPYDDINQKRILEEALDALRIFILATTKRVRIKSSDVLFAELTLIKEETKRELILSLVENVCGERIALNDHVIELADGMYPTIRDYMDALHVAFAAAGNCMYFVTCDEGITKHREKIEKYLKTKGFSINIRNPSEFVKEMGNEHEN